MIQYRGGPFIRDGLLASTVAVLPLQQATADDTRAFLPTGFLDVSTVASNGDQNPYGVAFVPHGFPSGGPLSPADILVSNFNNAGTSPTGNIQGTGTTITRIAPDGEASTFFTGVFSSPTDGGLTTALGVLKRGFVVVGQLPNNNGTPEPGSLLFLNYDELRERFGSALVRLRSRLNAFFGSNRAENQSGTQPLAVRY